FSLLTEADAFAPNKSGQPAIVRGSHRQSELYRRLLHEDPDLRMPFERPALSEKEVQLIAQWIDEGAIWEQHWAYQPPATDIAVPAQHGRDRAINEIDHFVFRQQELRGLSPNEPADSIDLIRRLYLDLTGLPPHFTQVENYLQDNTPNAYEKVVDQLLDSPFFGERWASMWLDLARYADTKGYEKDSYRSIWSYRDWVVQAFNEDMPFDQFTIEQLAGDLLPSPTHEQRIATAYHRNAIANDEGGTNNEQFRMASIIERVGNTYEVWMGSTFACVQCHSHPYDPFRQEEFYQSMAYFNNTSDGDLYNDKPKLYHYAPQHEVEVKAITDWLKAQLPEASARAVNTTYAEESTEQDTYAESRALLHQLGYRMVEAEEFDLNSQLIELSNPQMDMIWQVQDSSWVMYEDVDLTEVGAIAVRVATQLEKAGHISLHLDSINGSHLGNVEIRKTGEWKSWQWARPTTDKLFKVFRTAIPPIKGKRDLYLRFHAGDTYIQHLYYIDQLFYEMNTAVPADRPEVRRRIEQLLAVPTIATPIQLERPTHRRRRTHFLDRGSWLSPKQEVNTKLPAVLEA
ncbi:MAG: DUF1549 domain-containing protein, partial [Bacteroidota bacterium]